MAAKTYRFDLLTADPADHGTLIGSARAMRFLPAPRFTVSGFGGRPGRFVDYIRQPDTSDGWLYAPHRPKNGEPYIFIRND